MAFLSLHVGGVFAGYSFHFDKRDYEAMGREFCEALLRYVDPTEVSRARMDLERMYASSFNRAVEEGQSQSCCFIIHIRIQKHTWKRVLQCHAGACQAYVVCLT